MMSHLDFKYNPVAFLISAAGFTIGLVSIIISVIAILEGASRGKMNFKVISFGMVLGSCLITMALIGFGPMSKWLDGWAKWM